MKKKQLLSILLSLGLTMTAVTGCSDHTTNATEKTEGNSAGQTDSHAGTESNEQNDSPATAEASGQTDSPATAEASGQTDSQTTAETTGQTDSQTASEISDAQSEGNTGTSAAGSSVTGSSSVESYITGQAVTLSEVHPANADDLKQDNSGEFFVSTSVKDGVTQSGSTYTITKAGEYTFAGELIEGNIIVDAGNKDKVTLIFSGTTITCSTAAPVYIKNADKVEIKLAENSYNEINDKRAQKSDADSSDTDDGTDAGSGTDSGNANNSGEENASSDNKASEKAMTANGAIHAKADLTISGKGALVVNGAYNNGISTTKDLTIEKGIIKVTAVNNALKGNDSVTIEAGQLTLISTGGDGIKTSDSDVSSKGNQRGIITIQGGVIDIYAACDGLDAAYDVDISGQGSINIYTDSYSEYSDDVVTSGEDFYIIVPTGSYSDSYDYYAYYYNSDASDGRWSKATYATMVSGGYSQYYGLLCKAASGYENVVYCTFNAGEEPSVDSYAAATSGATVNKDKNGFVFTSVSGSSIEGEYVSLSKNSGGNSDKTEYSTKGIKADNTVTISGMNIVIYCKDDGIHANNDTTLSNGSTGKGNVTIKGGAVMITAADDGIHADNELTVSGGYINVVKSYEGLEANVVTVSGGESYIYASDDAVNACAGSVSPLVKVTGGYLDVTTPSGDTDAIDSNGSYEQTGGYVFVKGGSTMGSVAGSVDVDGTIKVTGGAIIALGGICEVPEDSVNTYGMSGTSFAAGEYTLKDSDGKTVMTFTLTGTYSSGWIASENLITGKAYTLTKDGSQLASWTQEEGTQGVSGSGFGGFGGGFGGFGGPGGFGGNGGAGGSGRP